MSNSCVVWMTLPFYTPITVNSDEHINSKLYSTAIEKTGVNLYVLTRFRYCQKENFKTYLGGVQ